MQIWTFHHNKIVITDSGLTSSIPVSSFNIGYDIHRFAYSVIICTYAAKYYVAMSDDRLFLSTDKKALVLMPNAKISMIRSVSGLDGITMHELDLGVKMKQVASNVFEALEV